MQVRLTIVFITLCLAIAPSGRLAAQGTERTDTSRLVLVELFTSQGCDMCPEAERLLGVLAASNSRVVPVAFHVDYFNDPWKDPFSEPLYSQRQAAYNAIDYRNKHPEYGLYYTPMVMVDGVRSENGRDLAGVRAAVKEASARRGQIRLEPRLALKDGRRSGNLEVALTSSSARTDGRELLVCAVLRDDRVTTQVRSGENANRELTARFPARLTRFEFVSLDRQRQATVSFSFQADPAWKPENLGLVVFAQDRKSGEIYGTVLSPLEITPGEVTPVQRPAHAAEDPRDVLLVPSLSGPEPRRPSQTRLAERFAGACSQTGRWPSRPARDRSDRPGNTA